MRRAGAARLPGAALGRALALAAVLAGALASVPLRAELAPWQALQWFEGRWRGTEEGVSGRGRASRCVAPLFDGRFQIARSRSELPRQPGNPEGERHRRWQLFGRDATGAILLDQFDSTGGHDRFRLDVTASRPDRLVFESVGLARGDAAYRARLVLAVTGNDRFAERLELGPVGGDLETVVTLRWRRIAPVAPDCLPPALAVE